MTLANLASTPAPVNDAADLIDRIDHAFLAGFARLSSDDLNALEALEHTFSSTPLNKALHEALEGISRSEFLDRHFLVLAAARAALQGAQHDALMAQLASALNRPTPKLDSITASATQAPPPQFAVWLESARHWLMELALAGFSNLGTDTLLPFQATLDQLESDERLIRQSSLLSGFLDELLSVFPTKGTPVIPLFRWADLWSRAMVLSADVPAVTPTRMVTGELKLLGADLRQHDNFATIVAFGVLREKGVDTPRLVRATASAFKVDVIQGEELEPLLADVADTLLTGLAGFKQLTITNMPLTPTHDLVWDDKNAKLGAAFDPLAEAATVLASAPAERPCLQPADRHPALIEELVYLKDYKVAGDDNQLTASIDGATLPIAHERWPSVDFTPGDLLQSTAMIALLRADAGRFSLQPITIGRKKPPLYKAIGTSFGGAKGKKTKTAALATLKERASKLLRKKS